MDWLTEIKQINETDLKLSPSFASNNEEKEIKLMNLDDFFRGIGVNIELENNDNDSEETFNSLTKFDETMNSILELSSEANCYSNMDSMKLCEDYIKLQPMVRKSRKQLTPEEQKDSRYWDKRAKNNFAAKRSRETRRMRENQIVLRANYLEKENLALKKVLKKLKEENDELKKILNQ